MGGRSASVQRAITDEDARERSKRARRGETQATKNTRIETATVKKAGFASIRDAKAAARKFAKGAFDKNADDSPDEARRKAAMRRKVKRLPKHYYSEYVGAKQTQKAKAKGGKATKPKKTAKKRSAEQRKKPAAKRTRPAPGPRAPRAETGRSAATPPAKFGDANFANFPIKMRGPDGGMLAFRSTNDVAAFNAGRR